MLSRDLHMIITYTKHKLTYFVLVASVGHGDHQMLRRQALDAEQDTCHMVMVADYRFYEFLQSSESSVVQWMVRREGERKKVRREAGGERDRNKREREGGLKHCLELLYV